MRKSLECPHCDAKAEPFTARFTRYVDVHGETQATEIDVRGAYCPDCRATFVIEPDHRHPLRERVAILARRSSPVRRQRRRRS